MFMTSSGSILETHQKAYRSATAMGLQMKDVAFENCADGMRQCMGPAKLKDVYNENFTAEWNRMKRMNQGGPLLGPYAAKD